MELLDYIKSTPLLRPTALPSSNNVAIVCRCSALMHIPDPLLSNLRAIYILDHQKDVGKNISKFEKMHEAIDVLDISDLKNEVSFDIVHYHHE